MRTMLIAAASVTFAIVSATTTSGQNADAAKAPEPKRPKLTLKARPEYAIAPARIVLTAELEGGSDDYEGYYCPTVVWEWGDGSASESASDCGPYEAGKSQIKRRYTVEHMYKRDGRMRVYFSLRQRGKELTSVGVNITLQPGAIGNYP